MLRWWTSAIHSSRCNRAVSRSKPLVNRESSSSRLLTPRDLVSAQGAELRALANLLEAKAAYERAVGRTLEVNRVSIADAKHGEVEKDTLIPGTLHGKVVGTEDLINLLPDGSAQK